MKFLKLLALIILTTSCASTSSRQEVKFFKPKTVQDYYRTSVLIYSNTGSGGSGVVWRSTAKESLVLTNMHICKSLKTGGEIYLNNKLAYKVSSFRVSAIHDLCMLSVPGNLGYNLKLKRTTPALHSKVFISGHPALYPHVLSTGHISDNQQVRVVTDSRECTEEEMTKDPIMCIFFGFPVYSDLDAAFASALIAPGSSGSGVFTQKGELVGLAFASNSEELSYALLVPWKYLDKFVREEVHTLPKVVPVEPTEDEAKQHQARKARLAPSIQKSNKFYDLAAWKKLIELLENTK